MPGRGKAAGVVLSAALLVVLAAGCGRYGGKLARRELVVHFAPGATTAQHLAARKACTGIPNTTPEPIVANPLPSERVNDIRFRIDRASDRDLARLSACLNRQPGVVGVDPVEPLSMR